MKKRVSEKTNIVLPLRYFLVGILIVVAVMSLPLLTVWKQAYISASSRKQDQLQDSLSTLKTTSVGLRLDIEVLSRTERIEAIAMDHLGLQYPASDHISIVRPQEDRPSRLASLFADPFVKGLRKSLRSE